tara:strand:- start:855 stop:1391 length:537 start_codon:yes stop_codon:yes gene_type:complete
MILEYYVKKEINSKNIKNIEFHSINNKEGTIDLSNMYVVIHHDFIYLSPEDCNSLQEENHEWFVTRALETAITDKNNENKTISISNKDKNKIVSELVPIYDKVKNKTHIEEYHHITLDNGTVVDGWIRNASGWELEEDDGKVICAVFPTSIEDNCRVTDSCDALWEFDINRERNIYGK